MRRETITRRRLIILGGAVVGLLLIYIWPSIWPLVIQERNDSAAKPWGPCFPMPGAENIDPCDPRAERVVLTEAALAHEPLGSEPIPIASMLDGFGEAWVTHLVVRGSYVTDTERCTSGDVLRPPDYLADEVVLMASAKAIKCYIDLRTNEYLVGSPTSDGGHLGQVTVMVFFYYYYFDNEITPTLEEGETVADVVEGLRRRFEQEVSDAYTGQEHVVFLGPPVDTSSQAWQLISYWDVQRDRDRPFSERHIAVHPDRDRWRQENPAGYEANKATLEMPLAAFDAAVDAAHEARMDANGGRIGPGTDLPMLVWAADSLRDYYIEVGAYDEGEPAPATPPPPCRKAVPNPAANPEQVQDCIVLLPAKDTLRGIGALNWSVDVTVANWDGVKISDSRVTKLELANRSLTGSVPAVMGNLAGLTRLDLRDNSLTGSVPVELGVLQDLQELWLLGNSLTGCIPVALQSVPTNDLDDLGLPDCA